MAYLYIYSRLDKFDYRLIYAPSNQILNGETRNEFINFAREVINTDNFGDIVAPRFALIKRDDITLIGVGCDNSMLGEALSGSEKRNIRGFFGVVIENCELSDIPVLCDIDFYKSIYENYYKPLWSLTRKDEHKVNSVVEQIEIPKSKDICFNQSDLEILNTKADCCGIVPSNTDVCELFGRCLDYMNIDVVFNVNSEKHVLNSALYTFRNISIIGKNISSLLELSEAMESECDSFDSSKNHTGRLSSQRTTENYSHSQQTDLDDCSLSRRRIRNTRARIQERDLEESWGLNDIVEFIKRLLKRLGVNLNTFASLFARSIDLEVVEKTKDEDANQEDNDTVPEKSSEDELISYDNDRNKRRSSIADIQAAFNNSNLSEIESIDVSPTDISSDDTESKNTGSISIEDIEVK